MCTKSLLLSSLIIASRLAIFSGSLPITFCRRKTLKTSQLSWCVHAHRLGYILRRHSLNSVDPYSLVHCWGYSTESKMDRYESWLTGSCCDHSFVATVASVWNEETGWYWMIVHLWFKLHFCKWISQSSCFFSHAQSVELKILTESLRSNLINELASNYKRSASLPRDFSHVTKTILRNHGSKRSRNTLYRVKLYVTTFSFIFLLYKTTFRHEMNKIIVLVSVTDVLAQL